MKGTLLLLALLATRELGFQTTEACIPFFEAFSAVAIGKEDLLYTVLDKFEATDQEKEAFGKIQQCYNKEGLTGKILDARVLGTITLSPECTKYYTADTIVKIKKLLAQVTSMKKGD